MQQFPIMQSQHQDCQDENSQTLVQRITQWGRDTFAIHPSNAEQFDDCDLDQRVRLSGEW